MSADTVDAKLQEVWREIIAAKYEDALRRFRHIQLEVFTVLLGEVALLREQVEELKAARREIR